MFEGKFIQLKSESECMNKRPCKSTYRKIITICFYIDLFIASTALSAQKFYKVTFFNKSCC